MRCYCLQGPNAEAEEGKRGKRRGELESSTIFALPASVIWDRKLCSARTPDVRNITNVHVPSLAVNPLPQKNAAISVHSTDYGHI